jgi:hypothetical protein
LIDEGGHAIDPAREINNTAVTYFTVSADQITIVRETPVPLTAAIRDDPGTGEDAQQNMNSSENLITDVPVVHHQPGITSMSLTRAPRHPIMTMRPSPRERASRSKARRASTATRDANSSVTH